MVAHFRHKRHSLNRKREFLSDANLRVQYGCDRHAHERRKACWQTSLVAPWGIECVRDVRPKLQRRQRVNLSDFRRLFPRVRRRPSAKQPEGTLNIESLGATLKGRARLRKRIDQCKEETPSYF